MSDNWMTSFFRSVETTRPDSVNNILQQVVDRVNDLVKAHNKEVETIKSLRKRIEKLEAEIQAMKPSRKLTIPGVDTERDG